MILITGFLAWIAGVLVIEHTGKDQLGSGIVMVGMALILVGVLALLAGF